MKYNKLLAKIFARGSNNDAQVAIALVAGLAAGAVISILFAPTSGANVRKGIADRATGLGNGVRDTYGRLKDRVVGRQDIEEGVAPEVPHFTHKPVRKRKSDIKDIIHEAHEQQNGEA
jgi:gas vesicle protein